MTLTGLEKIYDGFFMCDPPKPGCTRCRPFVKKRGLVPGSTVDASLKAAVGYRDANHPTEALHIAVFVRRADQIGMLYSAKVLPGETKAKWEAR